MNNQMPIWTRVNNQCQLSVKIIVDQIIASGKMSRQDHILLTSIVLADGGVGESERRQINRIFNQIQTGQLKLVNW